ncbi:MAG: Spo0B domain-containing protein [Bacillota bacterium]
MATGQEESRDLISILRTERHDFLNHLQVIVGYLQLNRHQKAHEYAREAIAQVSAGSALFSLQPPGLALCCLLNRKKAEDMGVYASFDCQTPGFPAECLLPEEIVSMAWDLVLAGFAIEIREDKWLQAQLSVSQDFDWLRFQVNWQDNTFERVKEAFEHLFLSCNERDISCSGRSIAGGWEISLEKRKNS